MAGGLNVVAPSANLAPPGSLHAVHPEQQWRSFGGFDCSNNRGSNRRPNAHVADTEQRGSKWAWVHADSQRRWLCLWNGGRMGRHGTNHDIRERLEAHGGDFGERLVAAGIRQITVLNPGGASSNTLAFPLNAFTVSPPTIAAGGEVTARWTGLDSPAATDRIGLYAPGAPNSAFLAWITSLLTDSRQSPGQRLVPLSSADLIGRWRL